MIARVFVFSYFPFPQELDWTNKQDMSVYFKGLPDAAFIMIIASHAVATFVGGLISALIAKSGRMSSGIIAGAILFAFILAVNFTFEFPVVYLTTDTLLTAIAAFLGAIFGKGRKV